MGLDLFKGKVNFNTVLFGVSTTKPDGSIDSSYGGRDFDPWALDGVIDFQDPKLTSEGKLAFYVYHQDTKLPGDKKLEHTSKLYRIEDPKYRNAYKIWGADAKAAVNEGRLGFRFEFINESGAVLTEEKSSDGKIRHFYKYRNSERTTAYIDPKKPNPRGG